MKTWGWDYGVDVFSAHHTVYLTSTPLPVLQVCPKISTVLRTLRITQFLLTQISALCSAML